MPDADGEGAGTSDELYIFSASKWVSMYTAVRAVRAGEVLTLGGEVASLDTPVAALLEFWGGNDDDLRAGVTLRHLLTQTSGMNELSDIYPEVCGVLAHLRTSYEVLCTSTRVSDPHRLQK